MCRFGTLIFVLAIVVALLAGRSCVAAVQIGDQGPNWAALAGVDGKPHDLGDYKESKVVVLVFTCNTCPVARAYEERLVALQRDYQAKGVQVVAIGVNHKPGDQLDAMKERAAEKGFNYPYLYDASQASARDYGARVTPHVFVLDQQRKIAYVGAVDDNMKAEKVTKKYLRNAIDALLAGKKPSPAQTEAFGCGVKYEQ
jgi:peroxiredoxin